MNDGGGVVECKGATAAHRSSRGEVVKVRCSVQVTVGGIAGVRLAAGGGWGDVLHGVENLVSRHVDTHLAQLFISGAEVTDVSDCRRRWTYALQSSAFCARHCGE